MMQERDIQNMVAVYELLKKANMQRVFFKEFQNYIVTQGEHILGRMSPEEEKAMKSTSAPIQRRSSRGSSGSSSPSTAWWTA